MNLKSEPLVSHQRKAGRKSRSRWFRVLAVDHVLILKVCSVKSCVAIATRSIPAVGVGGGHVRRRMVGNDQLEIPTGARALGANRKARVAGRQVSSGNIHYFRPRLLIVEAIRSDWINQFVEGRGYIHRGVRSVLDARYSRESGASRRIGIQVNVYVMPGTIATARTGEECRTVGGYGDSRTAGSCKSKYWLVQAACAQKTWLNISGEYRTRH